MPICIECSYPVPQLYQRLSSNKKPSAAALSATTPGAHARNNSAGHAHSNVNPPKDEGFRGGGEAKKAKANTADVRLMQCPRCKRFADKYVEHDFVVLFVDLVLVKPQVYRHLLFNNTRLIGSDSNEFTAAVKRLGTLLVLFDVYLTWSAIEALPAAVTGESTIPKLPILVQYIFYLALCTLTTVTQHTTVRELAQLQWFRGTHAGGAAAAAAAASAGAGVSASMPTSPIGGPSSLAASPKRRANQHAVPTSTSAYTSPQPSRPPSAASVSHPVPSAGVSQGLSLAAASVQVGTPLPPPRKNAVSTALLVSSCMKLFPILMVVWRYEDSTGHLSTGVSWAVAIQNVEALRILLGSGYGAAATLVALGWLARWLVLRAILMSVGLAPTVVKL